MPRQVSVIKCDTEPRSGGQTNQAAWDEGARHPISGYSKRRMVSVVGACSMCAACVQHVC